MQFRRLMTCPPAQKKNKKKTKKKQKIKKKKTKKKKKKKKKKTKKKKKNQKKKKKKKKKKKPPPKKKKTKQKKKKKKKKTKKKTGMKRSAPRQDRVYCHDGLDLSAILRGSLPDAAYRHGNLLRGGQPRGVASIPKPAGLAPVSGNSGNARGEVSAEHCVVRWLAAG